MRAGYAPLSNSPVTAAISPIGFTLHHTDAHCGARLGSLHTPHGTVQTPAFMPVGTAATVKGLAADRVRATGAQMLLANTYHLALRPGAEVIEQLGGLHAFMQWDGPILTDSGGFQIYSLAEQTRITEEAAHFRSHVDGAAIELSPERAIAIQEALGSDIAMVLDHVVALPADRSAVRNAAERTVRWAERCQRATRRADQAVFAIVQGGLEPDLRTWCAEQLVGLGFAGYAIGGLSVGETPQQMYAALEASVPALPQARPRYLMGVGRPQDLLEGIRRGVDMFDCVMPTRNGRNALAFTDQGTLRLRNECHRLAAGPLEEHCGCLACGHSRAYLRHLFQSGEMLGPILLSIHNLTYYQRLLREAREAIAQDALEPFCQQKFAGWQPLS